MLHSEPHDCRLAVLAAACAAQQVRDIMPEYDFVSIKMISKCPGGMHIYMALASVLSVAMD